MYKLKLTIAADARPTDPLPARSAKAVVPARSIKPGVRRPTGWSANNESRLLRRLLRVVGRSQGLAQSGGSVTLRKHRTTSYVLTFKPTPPAANSIDTLGSKGDAPIPRLGSTLELAVEVLANPGAWLRTPNDGLGNRPPIDLIGTDEEQKVYNLLNAAYMGLY